MTKEQNAERFSTALAVIAIVLVAVVVRPFAEALFLAAVLAGAIYPLQKRLTDRLRGHRNVSAAILSASVVLIVLIPTVIIGALLVKELVEGGHFVVETLRSDGVMGLVDRLPGPLRDIAHELIDRASIPPEQLDSALRDQAMAQQGKAAQTVRRALSTSASFALESALMVIALFFMLVDGPRLVAWCEQASPLKEGQTTELLVEFRTVAVSVIVSTLATGTVQTIAALVGYLIAGVPHPGFFAAVTFVMSFVPTIGAGGTCVAAALLLLATGEFGMAIFLAAWGTVTVGLSDNLIKPWLVKRGLHMHGAVVFFALLGGLAAFGAIGLILGPLIVSFLLTLVRMRRQGRSVQLVVAR